MNQFLRLSMNARIYELQLTRVGKYRLMWRSDCKELNEPGQHNLDYWKKRGVLLNEAEK